MSKTIKFGSLLLSAAALLGLSTISASARIVCNGDGDCWHVQEQFDYPPGMNLMIHPDDWRWKETERYSWREHPGRGYWKGRQWQEF